MELVDETLVEIEASERYVASERYEITTLTRERDARGPQIPIPPTRGAALPFPARGFLP
jgi:hypothetical protein